jgi:hypothetical protein
MYKYIATATLLFESLSWTIPTSIIISRQAWAAWPTHDSQLTVQDYLETLNRNTHLIGTATMTNMSPNTVLPNDLNKQVPNTLNGTIHTQDKGHHLDSIDPDDHSEISDDEESVSSELTDEEDEVEDSDDDSTESGSDSEVEKSDGSEVEDDENSDDSGDSEVEDSDDDTTDSEAGEESDGTESSDEEDDQESEAESSDGEEDQESNAKVSDRERHKEGEIEGSHGEEDHDEGGIGYTSEGDSEGDEFEMRASQQQQPSPSYQTEASDVPASLSPRTRLLQVPRQQNEQRLQGQAVPAFYESDASGSESDNDSENDSKDEDPEEGGNSDSDSEDEESEDGGYPQQLVQDLPRPQPQMAQSSPQTTSPQHELSSTQTNTRSQQSQVLNAGELTQQQQSGGPTEQPRMPRAHPSQQTQVQDQRPVIQLQLRGGGGSYSDDGEADEKEDDDAFSDEDGAEGEHFR